MVHGNVFELVGNTPTVRVRVSGTRGPSLFLKLEGCNPTGSIKDRACVSMLRSAVKDGSLTPGKLVLDASSGNFACSLAFYGKILGYSSVVAVSSKLTAAKRAFLSYFGTTIHDIGEFTIQGNNFCRTLAETEPDKYCFLDQLHNWRNPEAHYETTGPEIISDVPDVAMVVGSLGSGGTMTGVARYMKQVAPHVKIVVVECASTSRIPGTGTFIDGDYVTPFIRKAYDQAYFDHTIQITEADAGQATQLLVDQGIFAGLQTGGVFHAALTCACRLNIKGPVVALSGDTGWKNLDKLLPLAARRVAENVP
jgi:cysteine synthase